MLILVPWDELQHADEVHWCISGTLFKKMYLILFIFEQKENSSSAPRLHCVAHQVFANHYWVYQSSSWLWAIGASPRKHVNIAQEPSLGIHYPGFYVLKRWKRAEWLYVEGKHWHGQWGVRRKAAELRGRRVFQKHWAIFIAAPWQLKKVWAAQAPVLHVWQGPGASSALHWPIAQLCSPAVCHRAEGTHPSSGSSAFGGILALPHPPGRDAVHH